MSADASLKMMLRALKLPGFVTHHEAMALTATKAGWTFGQYLRALTDIEVQERTQRRIDRVMKAANLPLGKTRATLEEELLPIKVRRAVASLCEGGFADRAENILAFGLPGRGKTHVACAIGHELVLKGYRVLFSPTYKLVQRLLVAKRDLTLERELKRLDRFDVVILDDLGYVQQDRSEMEVLFTFLAERYERKSVVITSNLVFSKWDTIFKDAMTTAAAIDRLVHHSTILELTGDSYRTAAALTKKQNSKT